MIMSPRQQVGYGTVLGANRNCSYPKRCPPESKEKISFFQEMISPVPQLPHHDVHNSPPVKHMIEHDVPRVQAKAS